MGKSASYYAERRILFNNLQQYIDRNVVKGKAFFFNKILMFRSFQG